MLRIEPTERFSSRVGNYVRFRPSYPSQVVDVLRQECELTPDSLVADIASGTGIFTRLLLGNGNRVFGVEPNHKMRQAAEEYLSHYPKFVSVAGTAEATTLASHSIDLITCAQAAHWFDRGRDLHHPLDAHGGHQPRPGPHVHEYGHHDFGPSGDGIVAAVRAGQ